MVAVLKAEGLSKRFGKIQAVSDVGLEVAEGDVYGLLGLNGAGKTTTIRMILRLIRPDAGRVEIFGKDVRANFIEVMRDVGTLVELPAYYPHLSAVRNLDILRFASGGVGRDRVHEVLEQVGLGARRDSRVRTYSQGMRQRLGIAMALLCNPRLVLLDEPTNGLDPQGIHDIRNLIRDLNRERGVSFLISSHLLHEVEITCNRVGIIRDGRLVTQGSVDELLAQAGRAVRIECSPRPEALNLLRGLDYVEGVSESGETLTARLDPSHFARLNAELVRADIEVSGFSPVRPTLEEYFLRQ